MDAPESARRIRAAWGYSLRDQSELAKECGIHPDRFRAICARTNPKPATRDELEAVARATKVPRVFMESGFLQLEAAELAARIAQIGDDLATLKQRAEGQLGGADSQEPPLP